MALSFQRGTGYRHRPPTVLQRAGSALRSRRVAEQFAPTEHPPFDVLFRHFGPLDQGSLNACTGYGVAMGATIQAVYENVPLCCPLSPFLPYWAARRREVRRDEDVRDNGAFVDNVVWAVNTFGIADDESTPFHGMSHQFAASMVNDRPRPSQFRAALRMRSAIKLRMRTILDAGERRLQRLLHSLHLGQLCFLALPVAEGFLLGELDPLPPQSLEAVIGYHFVCVLDWRPSGMSYELLCGNSWGVDWGQRGRAWLSAELVHQSLGAWYLERVREE